MMRKYFNAFVLFCFLMIVGGWIFYKVILEPKGIEIDNNKYPIFGIDVSGNTGKIDFNKAKNSGVDFVIMRSSFGDKFDSKFETNFNGTKSCKLPIGVYHGFNFNFNWKLQCDRFLSSIEGKNVELFYFLDVEDWSPPSFKSPSEKIDDIRKFIKYFESQSGKKLMLYSNLDGYNKYFKGNFDEKSIWICSFNKNFKEPIDWIFWQYSHKGKFPFAQGYVDLNTYNGNTIDWEKFINNEKKSQPDF